MDKRRIAIIGSGISGLSAAWLLRQRHHVTLFEAEWRLGGHSNTVLVSEPDRQVAVDTGFMVFNRPNYPLLTRLFDELGVASYPTDMSFSVSLDQGALEYAGSNLRTLFAQRRNLWRPGFLRMLADVLRFNRLAARLLQQEAPSNEPLQRFLDRHHLGRAFRDHYLYPMAAAIWSCPRERIADFPAVSFARFFANHGLINLSGRPQWQTPLGGAATYVRRMAADLGERVLPGHPVTEVRRQAQGMAVYAAGQPARHFDEVVFACHPDQALRMFSDATPSEAALLRSVPYQNNHVLLHSDAALMPQRREVWSSWNYAGSSRASGEDAVSVSYWMNSLQRLDTQTDYFVSLNPLREPRPDKVVAEFEYRHPVFDSDSLALPRLLDAVQGRDRAWFCGAWTGYGFHEDGLRSGVQVAEALGASLPWQQQLDASQALVLPFPERRERAA